MTAPLDAPPQAPAVSAEFLERRRIVFTARQRSFVNARDLLPDGPVGFSSTELLLIAIGNCSLGTLFNHPLLAGAEVSDIRAELNVTMASDPSRVARIETRISAKVSDHDLLGRVAELEDIACTCPMCNSVTAEKHVTVQFRYQPAAG